MKGSRQIGIVINSLEKAYHYFVLLPDGAIAPSKEQVLAGKDGSDNIALKASNSGSNKYDSIQTGTFAPLHNKSYDVYVVLKDDAGNLSEPAKLDVTSPPAADFFMTGYPQIGDTQPDGSRQVEVKVKLQNIDIEKKGKVYWVLLPNGAAAPSIEQIASATDGNNSPAISSGSPEYAPEIEGSFIVTGETGATDYDVYMVTGNTKYAYPLAECTDVINLHVETPADIEEEKVCAIGSAQYGTLAEAFEAVKTGETIKLLKSFTSITGITIENKNINLDLNNCMLNITTTSNEGLKATNATLTLMGEGKLNVSGRLYGVRAESGSDITVTNAAASDTGELGMGVYAINGSKVTVRENVFGTAHGVKAENIYTKVTVNGDVSSKGQIKGAVHCTGQADVIVKGNVTNTSGYGVHSIDGTITVEKNVSGSHVGAMSEGNEAKIIIKGDLSSYNNGAVIVTGIGSITVDGEIITSGNYVRIYSKDLTKADGVFDPEKLGYLKYSDNSVSVSGKVWVKDSMADMACQIGSVYYDSLEKALTEVKTGEAIKLLKDISYAKSVDNDGAISVKDKKITIDLNGNNLSVSNPAYSGLDLSNNAEINIIGGGKLNISSRFAALNISYSKFTSDSTVDVLLESELNSGISAYSSSSVDIQKGAVKGGAAGINAYSKNSITVAGPVTSDGIGESHGIALAGIENIISVKSVEVISGSGSGIYMYEGGLVTVGTEENPGYVIGKGDGITTRQGSKRAYVTVYGNVEGGAHGIYATDDAEIKIFGNVKSTSANNGVYCVKSFAGITSSQSNLIEIHGNVDGINGVYVGGTFGNIKITGNVTANGTSTSDNCGVYASYGSIEVGGNVNAPNCVGAEAGDNGQITIDGSLIGKVFAWVYYQQKTAEDKTLPTTKDGYHTYRNNTAVVWVKADIPAVDYALTVQNGTGSGNYTAGTKVNIFAGTAPEGQVFSHWTTDNGGSFQDAGSAYTEFTMPANAVTVTANYKAVEPSDNKYIITATAGTGGSISPEGSIEVEENSSQTFAIIPNNNYKISSVVVDGVEQGAISAYIFNNVTTCHAISAVFTITTSSGIQSDSSGGTTTIVIIKPDKKPDQPLVAATTINPKLDKDGNAIASVSNNVIKDVINKANSEAKKQNRTENGIGVCLETKNSKSIKSFSLVLTQPALKLLTDSNVQQFEIECEMLNLNFNLEALREIRKQSSSDVTISITENTVLVRDERELIEVRSAYDISLSHIHNGKNLNITDLNNGKITLSIPYTLEHDDAVGYLFGIMTDGKGSVNRILKSVYDVNNKKVIIDNDILFTYGVGYTSPSARFTDISAHWAKESINYIVGRDLFKGTTDTTFSPDLTISRGMLVTVLGRLTEANVSMYRTSSFADVADDMYYMPYIEWAYVNGIIKGVDGNKFEPDRGMTREEVALVLQNYAKAINFNPPVLHDVIAFADNDNISDYAKDAVKIIQQAGIIMGDQNNKFNPKNAVSRGEIAAILQRCIKLTIDPATAQGWTKKDDGQWFYYKDGKHLTGWQSINDKKYYFNADGALQIGWLKDNNSWEYIEK